MTTFATLLFVAAFGYLVYRYLPRGTERAFRLERFHPRTPVSDRPASYYDERRRYTDLAAIYGRNDVPETTATPQHQATPETGAEPERSARRLTSVRTESATPRRATTHPSALDRKAS